MSGSNQPGTKAATTAASIDTDAESGGVCPFCGTAAPAGQGACTRCGMENTPATRQATRARLGPWYVLQTRNPSAPGMRYATLLSLIAKGRITSRSVVRGPTTNQFWKSAVQVRGVSRHFAVCYACGGHIAHNDSTCSHCARSQEPPADPDVLLDGSDTPAQRTGGPVFRQIPAEAGALAAMPSDLSPEIGGEPSPRRASDAYESPTHESNDGATGVDLGGAYTRPSPGSNPRPAPRRKPPEHRMAPSPRAATGGKGPAAPANSGNGRNEDDEPERPIEDRILSPRDLAAAFSLDFDSPVPEKNRRSGTARIIAGIIVTALVIVSGVVFAVPSLRGRANRMYQALVADQGDPSFNPIGNTPPRSTPIPPEAKDNSEAKPAAGASAAGAAKNTAADHGTTPTQNVDTPSVGPAQAAPAPTSPAPASGGALANPAVAPSSKPPAVASKPPAVAIPAPGDLAPAVVYPTVSAPTPSTLPINMHATAADFDAARKLHSAGIDAESHHNYLAAEADYQAIEQLPPEAWPADVPLRLAAVQKNLNK